MKLIAGLGNPGKEYEKTRHNAGFGFIDFFMRKFELQTNNAFQSELAEISLNGEKCYLLKPQTFMNKSGIAVSEIVRFYKIPDQNIFIAFDDLDIREGDFKIQKGKYPKVHNGVNDIINKLGTDELNFIRIGVDGRSEVERQFIPGHDYVLSRSVFDYSEIYLQISKSLGFDFK